MRSREIASEEYFRALNQHPDIRNIENCPRYIDPGTYYTIDKTVRNRMRAQPFGFDYSEVLNLEVDLREKSSKQGRVFASKPPKDLGQELVNRLSSNTDPTQKPKRRLTFDEWKRKKTTEARLKKRLIEESVRNEYKRRMESRDDVSSHNRHRSAGYEGEMGSITSH